MFTLLGGLALLGGRARQTHATPSGTLGTRFPCMWWARMMTPSSKWTARSTSIPSSRGDFSPARRPWRSTVLW